VLHDVSESPLVATFYGGAPSYYSHDGDDGHIVGWAHHYADAVVQFRDHNVLAQDTRFDPYGGHDGQGNGDEQCRDMQV